ncbi:MAG TPA: hypothetical protein VGE27_02645 [Gemmatimonas sp.]
MFPLLLGAAVVMSACASAPKPPAEVPSSPVQMAPPEPETPVSNDGMTPAFSEAFAAADLRARAIAFYQQCVPTVARLRSSARFGAAARAPRVIFCERDAEGVPIGGVFDVDSAFKTARQLSAVRLDGDRPKYTGLLDTAAILSRAKLARDANKLVAPVWAKLKRPFTVVPVTVASGAHEAWVIPRATRAGSMVIGGDAAYVAAAGGTGVQQTMDRTKTWMQVALPARGAVTITSAEPGVAAVTDLASARYYTELGRDVTVITTTATSKLTPGLDPATGARVVWKHQPTR